MKIVIAGGSNEADFLIAAFLNKGHHLLVINDDYKYCDYLSSTHNISVIYGDPCKQDVLNDAHIDSFDIIIALKNDDADNFAICQAAKKIYGVKKAICIVSNPKNVEVFKKLGINTVISATYMVANIIVKAASIEDLIDSLSISDESIAVSQLQNGGEMGNYNEKHCN